LAFGVGDTGGVEARVLLAGRGPGDLDGVAPLRFGHAVADILPDRDDERETVRPAPTAAGKWPTASVSDDAAAVIAAGFDEACRRDPDHQRSWVVRFRGCAPPSES
jgi:hypothetical protein